MRINRYLASCGLASRRGVEKLILEGRVTVNGKRVSELGFSVDEGNDKVRVDGKQVHPQLKKVYVIFNKPKGLITTAKDEHGRKSVMDVINVKERIFPVGRLDRNSEGLLLLTNDGDLAHRLLHPSYNVTKTYRAKLDQPFKEEDFGILEAGVELDDGMSAPCRAFYYRDDPHYIELNIHEGRKHIVRRMFAALGYEVKALKRTKFGPLTLKNLNRGQWRMLSPSELYTLRKSVGLLKKTDRRTRD